MTESDDVWLTKKSISLSLDQDKRTQVYYINKYIGPYEIL